jgi:tight adherence protein B
VQAVLPRVSVVPGGAVVRSVGREPRRRWAAVGAAGAVLVLGGAGTRLLVPLLLAAAGAAVVSRLRRTRPLAAARRDERARAVEACAALAGELRAGRAPADALDAAAGLATGPSAVALRTAAGAVRLGGDPAPSLRSAPDSAVPEVLRALAACWAVCAGSGAGLAAAVERLEEGLRAEQAQRRAVDAELAGPRATAGLLAVLPAGGLLLAAGLGADPLSVLLTTPVGLLSLVVGLALDAAGVWWTGRLVASAGGRA